MDIYKKLIEFGYEIIAEDSQNEVRNSEIRIGNITLKKPKALQVPDRVLDSIDKEIIEFYNHIPLGLLLYQEHKTK